MKSTTRRFWILPLLLLLAACGSDSTTPNGSLNSNPVNGNIVFTGPWTGEWNVVIVFKDCASGDTLNIEDITDVICDGDTLDIGLSAILEDCGGTITDTRLMVDCQYEFKAGSCTVTVSATLDIERQGDQLMGTGQWSVVTTGACATPYLDGCENIEISGIRINSSPAECAPPQPLSLIERFAPAPRAFLRTYQR